MGRNVYLVDAAALRGGGLGGRLLRVAATFRPFVPALGLAFAGGFVFTALRNASSKRARCAPLVSAGGTGFAFCVCLPLLARFGAGAGWLALTNCFSAFLVSGLAVFAACTTATTGFAFG